MASLLAPCERHRVALTSALRVARRAETGRAAGAPPRRRMGVQRTGGLTSACSRRRPVRS
jgi:hypothetical protein